MSTDRKKLRKPDFLRRIVSILRVCVIGVRERANKRIFGEPGEHSE